MRFRARKTFRFGPFYMTITQSGGRSYGIKLGPLRYNFSRGTTTLDSPGPGSLHFGGKRRRR